MKANSLAILVFMVLAVVLGPLLLIWAINTLFLTNIGVYLDTWAAMLVLMFAAGVIKVWFKLD